VSRVAEIGYARCQAAFLCIYTYSLSHITKLDVLSMYVIEHKNSIRCVCVRVCLFTCIIRLVHGQRLDKGKHSSASKHFFPADVDQKKHFPRIFFFCDVYIYIKSLFRYINMCINLC
jgi:hypothetical protein